MICYLHVNIIILDVDIFILHDDVIYLARTYGIMKIPFDYVNKAIRVNKILSIISNSMSVVHCFKPIGDPHTIHQN